MSEQELITILALIGIVLLLIVVAIVIFLSQYRKRKIEYTHNQMIMQQQHQQELLQREINIQAQTMKDIGQDIHDNVGQKLTLASIQTQQLAIQNEANNSIVQLKDLINEALHDVRNLSRQLANNSVSINELKETIAKEKTYIELHTSIAYNIEYKILPTHLPYQYKYQIHRILQEFTSNSIKYAQCKTITVELNLVQDIMQVNIKDDGKGFDINGSHKGIGIKNMNYRASLMAAECNVVSTPQGTSLTIKIPINNK
jgi:signal transduction histidine kinase